MSKPSAIFSYSPMKSVRSSPASTRSNSTSKQRNQQVTSAITESSPRKCRSQTEIKSSPIGSRATNINVKSRLQITEMSTKTNKDRRITNPSPKKDQATEENQKGVKKQTPGSKMFTVTGVVQLQNPRGENKNSTRRGLFESASENSDFPSNINVKTMRSCFERKENKVPSKPPPSPSLSRLKPQTSVTRNNSNNIKGILSTRSRFDNSPSKFRVPSGQNSTPTSHLNKLRRSVSTGTLADNSPVHPSLLRSHSQHTMTPKYRVRFQDEATPGCFSPVLLETQGSGESIVGETTNLTVAIRVRPPLPGEHNVVSVDGRTVKVRGLDSELCFSYDYCFSSTGDHATSQQQVFDTMVQPLVDAAFQSYNVCLFAYGQTGSGKSYSMMGEEITSSDTIPEKAGIIPRFSQQLFRMIESSKEYAETQIEISYFEIYNEKIHDLLGSVAENGRGAPLRVREHPELGPYVVDLAVRKVDSFRSLQDWLRAGNNHKATAATEMNINSSRSHSIFTITLTQPQDDDRPSVCSKINLVDLAGSERLAHTCASGDRLKEGVSINRSLLTLGKVISSLAENKRGFIPYRESVLTWLLRESLGGNSHTAMLATISPSSQFVEETLSTLRYACQARNIVNTVRINERPHEKKIRELVEEIQRLKDGLYSVEHSECEQKVQTLQEELDQAKHDLARAKRFCAESEKEVEKLEKEWAKTRDINFHADCDRKVQDLQSEISKTENQNIRLEREIRELRKDCLEAKEEKFEHEIEIKHLKETLDDMFKSRTQDKEKIHGLEYELEECQKANERLISDTNKLERELEECRRKNSSYENDLSRMKTSMLEIKKTFSHDHCESQILMLQTALDEATRFSQQVQEKLKSLEKKYTDITNTSNHEGCEKEISFLKETIKEIKQSADHGKCDKVIEKLKNSLSEAEELVSSLQKEVNKLKEENTLFQTTKNQNEKDIMSLQRALSELEKTVNHTECEERLDTLKKALSVAKSMNVHVQCENRITELEMEIRNLQSVTLADHSRCDEKIDNLFYAVEKYADENNKLEKKQKEEINQHAETVRSLKEQISNLTLEIESKKNIRNCQDLVHLENQLRLLKDENSKLKKKKVEDEKRISSLEQQVISLTKQLLDVKNQLRASVREKESSESLCSQLQEQLMQQDRKLALTQSSSQLEDDKENWETPSKVIRRSIAQYSKSKKSARSSLVMKAEEIHQSLKDAEDICSRLKIPWVFKLEPEVTTNSWFDVNVRVWDQRNMSSVRWPQDVFLGWLRDMKETILSKSRGHTIFQSATWMQDSKNPESLPQNSGETNKKATLKEEVDTLQSRIMALEGLCDPNDKHQVLSAITSLGKSVTQLSSKLGLSSPLKSSNARRNLSHQMF